MGMDLLNKRRAGVEDDEKNLVVVSKFAGDAGDGQKRTPNVHRKSSSCKLQRPI
jgi:hypothetical protein